MGYQDIKNLYRPEAQTIFLFREAVAMEKIHGTSSHVRWKDGRISFFSGGASHDAFVALFDVEKLTVIATEKGLAEWVIYGEAYGGKMQGMSHTYGKELRFVAFDVKIHDNWIGSTAKAEQFALGFGLEFVPWAVGPATIEWLAGQRDLPSRMAVRRGIAEPRIAEGIVIRPVIELQYNDGGRVCAKYKRAEFSERGSKADTLADPAARQELNDAREVAEEWVTEERLNHILDCSPLTGLPIVLAIEHTGDVVKAMVADVYKEGSGEVPDTKAVRSAISKRAAGMYKNRVFAIKE
jgi:hypothetical protein